MDSKHKPAKPLKTARGVAVIGASLALLAGCATGQSAQTNQVETAGEVIATDLAAPWSIAFYGDTPLVSERDSGRIVELDSAGKAREIGVITESQADNEAGLLGLAVHEDYLYAYYTAGQQNKIVRMPLTGTPGSLALGAPETVLDGIPAADYHDGGRIAFGPDGMLYATVGDAGVPQSAQDLEALSGKILRMTPEGGVPTDNPFAGSLVYSYGHRNPQGIAWDQAGTMYSSEFGEDTWDELNVIEAGGNYGWPEAEGESDNPDYINPRQQWAPADASPSGIEVHSGQIWIANLRGKRLRQVPISDLSKSTEHLVNETGRLRDVATAPDGSLWVLTNNTDGRGDPAQGDDRIIRFEPETAFLATD